MNTTNKQYSTQAIDPSILDVLDISIDGKVVSAENWKTLWELVFKHINTLDAYCVTLEELRSEWSNSKALLDKQMLDFTSKYAALEQSFVHYGEAAPVNEHIKLWVQPVSNLKDKVLITFKELLATEDLLTNRINTLQDEMNLGFVALRDTLDNDYVSNTEAANSFYTKSEIESIVNNIVSIKADKDKILNFLRYEKVDNSIWIKGYYPTYNGESIPDVIKIPSIIDGYPVSRITEDAFFVCTATTIHIPESVEWVEDKAFRSESLSTIIFHGNDTEIGFEVFNGCCPNLTKIVLPKNIQTIPSLHSTSITDFTIPNSVEHIGVESFRHCKNLTSITIPDSVVSIGDKAFYKCESLTSVTIPDSVTSISCRAFHECESLTDIYYEGSKEQWESIHIYEDAIPTDVTIHYNQRHATEEYVNNIVVNQVDNLYTYEIIDSEYEANVHTKTVTITGAVEKCAKYVIPSFIEGYPVTAIGASAFTEDDKDENGTILREVVIPDGVTSIGKEAFCGCLQFEVVTLPDSIWHIGKAAFSSSSDITVYYGGTGEQWSRIIIDEDNNALISPKNIYYNQKPATVNYVNSKVKAVADLSNYYTKAETDAVVGNIEFLLGGI